MTPGKAGQPGSRRSPVLEQFMLNANQIKVIALIIMTVDHVGAFMSELPWVAGHYTLLRSVGRIAAPLFLFLLTESVRHTRSRPRFALRLYLANLAQVAVQLLRNTLLAPLLGYGHTGNIFQTFLATALVISGVDLALKACQKRDLKAGAAALGIAALLAASALFGRAVDAFDFGALGVPMQTVTNLRNLAQALLPSLLKVEYTPVFVLLGTVWYYSRQRLLQAFELMLFSFIPRLGLAGLRPLLGGFANPVQFWMILAAPFILLYNGQKGGGTKYFFYAYYILHPYVLIALARILAG